MDKIIISKKNIGIFMLIFLGIGIFLIGGKKETEAVKAICLSTHAGYCSAVNLNVGEETEVNFEEIKRDLEDIYTRNNKTLGYSYMEYSDGFWYWRCNNMQIIKFEGVEPPCSPFCDANLDVQKECKPGDSYQRATLSLTNVSGGSNYLYGLDCDTNNPFDWSEDATVSKECVFTTGGHQDVRGQIRSGDHEPYQWSTILTEHIYLEECPKSECGSANQHSGGYEKEADFTSPPVTRCAPGSTVSNFDNSHAGLASGAYWAWDCTKAGYDTVHCSVKKTGECQISTGGPFDKLDDGCKSGHLNSIHLVGETLRWTCGTNGYEGKEERHVGSFVSDNVNLDPIVSADGIQPSTSCSCIPHYVYSCVDGGIQSCAGRCGTGETTTHFSIPHKQDTACFPNQPLPVTEDDYPCPDTQIPCPPCGTVNGGADSVIETN